MKRKKAKKERQKEVDRLNNEILLEANNLIDYAIKQNKKAKPNPFEIIGKVFIFVMKIKSLINQKDIVKSQPLPLKHKYGHESVGEGYLLSTCGKDIIGGQIIGKEETERILNHNQSLIEHKLRLEEIKEAAINLSNATKLNKEDCKTLIESAINKDILDKLDSIEIRFKQ